MKTLVTSKGIQIPVDDDVYEWASQYKWSASKKKNGRYEVSCTIRLSREIMKGKLTKECPFVDHRDGDGLNNMRENLRISNHQLNSHGFRRVSSKATSKYRGVYFDKSCRVNPWRVRVKANKKEYRVGNFPDEITAAREYDVAARKLGLFEEACNFPK